jgi:hypothetical protein
MSYLENVKPINATFLGFQRKTKQLRLLRGYRG